MYALGAASKTIFKRYFTYDDSPSRALNVYDPNSTGVSSSKNSEEMHFDGLYSTYTTFRSRVYHRHASPNFVWYAPSRALSSLPSAQGTRVNQRQLSVNASPEWSSPSHEPVAPGHSNDLRIGDHFVWRFSESMTSKVFDAAVLEHCGRSPHDRPN